MSNVVRLEYAYGVCPKCKRVHYLRYLIHYDGLIHKPYEIKCLNCDSYFTKEDIFGNGEETTPKPMTHYDRLISKTPEELAQAIEEFSYDVVTCPKDKCHLERMSPYDSLDRNECRKCWLAWLKSPVEVDNG